jgi:hypothetical protein
LNARRPHIKNSIGYKMRYKHNIRVNNNGREFIKFVKDNSGQEFIKFVKDNSDQVKQDHKSTNHVSNVDVNTSYMSYHAFDTSYVLTKNKHGKVIALYVGHTTRGLRLMCGCPKCL